ncbi:hypothetical protein BP00DRAFT_449196 [Aspergillus indologenus CBS 114.80]|uniref:Peptidase S8/S53 domain-containing protein n=1 Tax=Aspergillus indologenus CBS 114.80 TaxID=1450541 RepID=A0A2V5HXN4_9EURO|nr:hypothetical protein BP00DRAFT_449196 [Aspergillus indologenus CBS 114.80]
MGREIQVAVLDSGCMKPPGEFPQLAGFEDLVRGGTVCYDKSGHGTEIVSLMTSLSCTIKVQVRRIGDGGADLEVGGQIIADAIRQAAEDPRNDIICMAFYVPEDDRISRAIDEAFKHRNGHIMFIAAATAAKCSEVMFPASHRYVIAARPLDLTGSLWSDQPLVRKSPREVVIETLGECVPVADSKQIKVYRSGSSIAAAILVAIAAALLESVDLGRKQRKGWRLRCEV